MKQHVHYKPYGNKKPAILLLASVASMIDQFNMPNIRILQQLGCEVHVACNFKKGNTCDARRVHKLREILGKMGVTTHAWDCPRNIRSIIQCKEACVQLVQLIDREHFAGIHCQSPIGGALARIAAHHTGIPVMYTAHGFHFYKGAPFKNWLLYYPAEKLLAYWTDVLVTINREDYCFAKRHLKAKSIYYIPGVGIEVQKFWTNPNRGKRVSFCGKYSIPPDALLLLSVGELNRGKNHKMVISALAGLARKDVFYLICGQGELREKLQEFADSLGVGRQIRLPGYQEDMQAVYENADIFVFPSLREGMPVALMEAMAAGLACVVSDIRGNRELIGEASNRVGRPGGAFCLKKGGASFPLNRHGLTQLTAALDDLLAKEARRRSCGSYNRNKIQAYRQAVVDARMKKIYQAFAGLWQEQQEQQYEKDAHNYRPVL